MSTATKPNATPRGDRGRARQRNIQIDRRQFQSHQRPHPADAFIQPQDRLLPGRRKVERFRALDIKLRNASRSDRNRAGKIRRRLPLFSGERERPRARGKCIRVVRRRGQISVQGR